VYAYAHTLVESDYFTGPLTTAVFDYAQTLSTEGTLFESIQWASSHQVYWFRSPMFYNNIELVKVSYLEDPRVREFTETVVEASKGTYGYRWGDAIIRYWQVVLFSKRQDVWCMQDFAQAIRYRHQPFLPDFAEYNCDLMPQPEGESS